MSEHQHLCPRDSTPLHEASDGRAHLYACKSCEGIWIGPEDVERVAGSSDQYDRLPSAVERLAIDDTARCCCDGKPLMRTLERDGVRIDICPECSALWLDRGELQALLENRSPTQTENSPSPWQTSVDAAEILFDLEFYFGAVSSVFEWVVDSVDIDLA